MAFAKSRIRCNPKPDSYKGKAIAVAVSGQDVYACGDRGYNNGSLSAKLWKNNIDIPLTDNLNHYLTGMAVSGSNIYLVGLNSNPGILGTHGV